MSDLPERVWIDDRNDELWMDRTAALVGIPEASLIEFVRADIHAGTVRTLERTRDHANSAEDEALAAGAPPSAASDDYLRFTFENLRIEQKWSGRVEAVRADHLDVVLTDVATGEEEFTTMEKTQVSGAEAARAVEGASFIWVIGHLDEPSGRLRVGVSLIQFTEPSTLSEAEQQAALDAGDVLAQSELNRIKGTA